MPATRECEGAVSPSLPTYRSNQPDALSLQIETMGSAFRWWIVVVMAVGMGYGQQRVVTTAVPTLRIVADARSAGMGDAGVATSPDEMSTYWNSAKLAWTDKQIGIQLSSTPWLRKLVNDIWLHYFAGYYQIDDRQVVGAAVRYFDLGELTCYDELGQEQGFSNPHEFAADVHYARKFSDRFSLGVALRLIYSRLLTGECLAFYQATGSTYGVKPAGKSAAGDISFFYTKPVEVWGVPARWNIGVAITNLGAKIAYTESTVRDFLPTNLGVGTALHLDINPDNSLEGTIELNKLLVPTPDSLGKHRQMSVVEALYTSFYDAPGGLKEELREVNFSTGLEYIYLKQFAFRAGYFYEHPQKGNRQFFTLGIGFTFNVFRMDISYLIPTSPQLSPLSNTFRFTFRFNLARAPRPTKPAEQ